VASASMEFEVSERTHWLLEILESSVLEQAFSAMKGSALAV
jgi:hypothetical protein